MSETRTLDEIVSSLAAAVEIRWREKQYDFETLPEIAFEELQRAELVSKISYDEILRYLMAMGTVQEGYDPIAEFSETLWIGEHFHIQLLVWLDSNTRRHQHIFYGALKIIYGAICHATFSFSQSQRINNRVETGSIQWVNTKILRTGDVQGVHGGECHVHSFTHLRDTAMALVVRSNSQPTYHPQWNYYVPSVRIDPFVARDGLEYALRRTTGVVAAGWQSSVELGDELARSWLDSCDLESALLFLIRVSRPGLDGEADAWRRTIHQQLSHRWPELWSACEAAIEKYKRNADVAMRCRQMSESNQRFVLRVLMNVPDRQTVLDLIATEFDSDEPHTTIAEQLLAMGVEGCGIKMERTSSEVLGLAISGSSLTEIVEALKEKYGTEQVEKGYSLIEQNYQAFCEAYLLRALF